MYQKVVLVAGADELRDHLLEALGPFSAEAVEVPSGARALELTQQIPIDLLVVRYPIEGMKFSDFVRAFRENGCASRGAQIVALAPGRSIGGLKRTAGAGVAFVRSDSNLNELEQAFTTFLRRSPRFEERLLVGVDLELKGATVRKMLQIKNISETGMLVKTNTPIPIGTRLDFELGLPELRKPILGKGEVVRVVGHEEGGGSRALGVRIASFVADGEAQLAQFLEARRHPQAGTQ